MVISKDILNELEGISPAVAAVPRVNVFTVDAAYFDGIEAELKARIAADSFYTSKDTYSVPQGYFDNLAGNIMNRIKAEEDLSAKEEMRNLSEVIAGIGNKNVFTVPAGYFEKLTPKKEEKTPAKVVQMNRRPSIFRYAAAAVITGFIGLSVINLSSNKTVSSVDENAMQLATTVKAADQIIKTNSFDKELNSLTDEDLEQYLSGNGENVNAAVIAASAAEKGEKLPEASDYILNENTLDEFLNENNLKN